MLSQIRALRGEIVGARDLKYVDLKILDVLDQSLAARSEELSNACVNFLLQENSLLPYETRAQSISENIINLQKAIDAKTIEEEINNLSSQLELLVDIVNNLKIEDTSQSTQIIENISVIFARLNQERFRIIKKEKRDFRKRIVS